MILIKAHAHIFTLIVLTITTLLVSCQQPATYQGRLLLLNRIDPMGVPSAQEIPGIYELVQGLESPQLLWGDLPIELECFTCNMSYPILSPKRNFALILNSNVGSDYLVNLETGEGHVFPTPGGIHPIFSPDNRYVAYTTEDARGMYVIDLESINWDVFERITKENELDGIMALERSARKIFEGKCSYYCLDMVSPFWIDDQTLLVAHDSNFFNSDYKFTKPPEYITVNSYGIPMGVNVIGETNMLTILQIDGKIISHLPTPNGMTFFEKNGTTYLMSELNHDELFWVDVHDTVENNTFTYYPLGIGDARFYSISPDNKSLLRYTKQWQWELVDIKSGNVTVLHKKPDVNEIVNCVWAQDGKSVACIGRIWNKNEYQLFIKPLSGDPPTIVQSWENVETDFGWFLLTWQP